MTPKQVAECVGNYITANRLIDQAYCGRVIIALSGGADSVALLCLMLQLGYDCVALHCNFHLRGEESDRDMHFVQNLCCKKMVELVVRDFDTEAYATRHQVSVEMAARELRYDFFNTFAIENNIGYIAVAHHMNDSIETFLLNSVRGAGIHGLTGIKPKNGKIIRPLLCLQKDDVLGYVKAVGQDFVTDSTNSQDICKRNIIRNAVLPLLMGIEPSAVRTLSGTASNVASCEGFVDEMVASLRQKCCHEVDEVVTIDLSQIRKYHSYGYILYELLRPFGTNRDICESIVSMPFDASGKLFKTKGYLIAKNRSELIISRLEEDLDQGEYIVRETDNMFGRLLISARTFNLDRPLRFSSNTCYIDKDKARLPLKLRRWRDGDYFYPFGMTTRKKVSDFLVNEKISVSDKRKLWLLTDSNDEIVWLVGLRNDNRFRISELTKNALVITTNCSIVKKNA